MSEDSRSPMFVPGAHSPGGEAAGNGPFAVELRKLNKHFGSLHVLSDVDLKVSSGEVVAVLGPSGSGKSTMCRVINGLETIDSGEVLLHGDPLPSEGKELKKARSEVGMVFQQFNLFQHMSVLDNVTLGPIRARRIPRKEAQEYAMELLERVGVAEQSRKLPAQLSGGQQQRVAIARSLAMNPKIMLFDEPTSALDPELVHEVLDVMRSLAEAGMTMIVVTHETGFARSAATRIVFMDQGKILDDQPPKDFFENPGNARAEEFIAKILRH